MGGGRWAVPMGGGRWAVMVTAVNGGGDGGR